MACCRNEKKGYKWVVLVAACFSQILRAGFISGTLSLFSIYYVGRYSDRTLSSSIGAVQISMANLSAFPTIMLNKRIGERWTQIIGGFLTAGGMAGTAFTTEAWQGILANGVISGLGAAFLSAGTYSVLSKYFPGSQLAPYAAITVCQNIGVLATPQVIGIAIASLGFSKTFLICSGSMLLNVITGLLFLPNKVECDDVKSSPKANNISLKFTDKKQGIYDMQSAFLSETSGRYKTLDAGNMRLATTHSHPSNHGNKEPLELGTVLSKKKELLRSISIASMMQDYYAEVLNTTPDSDVKETKQQNGFEETESISTISSTNSTTDASPETTSQTSLDKSPSVYEIVRDSRGHSIANMLDSSHQAKQSVKQFFRTKAALNFLLTSFITTGGYVAFNSIIGDFSKMSLQLTDEQYVLGLTILGVVQLVTGIFYLLIARFFTFCGSFMYVVSIIGASSVTFLLLTQPSITQFQILMGVSGFFKSLYIASTFAAGMEVTSPAQAVYMFMIVSFVEGVGGIIFPYLSSYLQVQVNLSAGMYLAGGVQLLGALTLAPLSIKFLVRPRDYTKHADFVQLVEQVGYQPNRPF